MGDTALDGVSPCKAMSCSANVLCDLKHTFKTENGSSVTRYFLLFMTLFKSFITQVMVKNERGRILGRTAKTLNIKKAETGRTYCKMTLSLSPQPATKNSFYPLNYVKCVSSGQQSFCLPTACFVSCLVGPLQKTKQTKTVHFSSLAC